MKHEPVISSSANPVVKWLRALSLRKNREEEGVFVIEGQRDVLAALAGGYNLHTLVTVENEGAGITAPLHVRVTAELMSRIANRDNAQPVMGVFYQYWAKPDACTQGLWLGLEDIRDPGNLGTIIRTCDAVSAKGIVLIGNTCDPYAPEAVKAAMGSLARVGLCRMTASAFLAWRSSYKGQVLGTHLAGANDYRAVAYADDCLLIMGSETAGLSDAVANICDARVKIPMSGGAESLNLGVASALMLYEARRKTL